MSYNLRTIKHCSRGNLLQSGLVCAIGIISAACLTFADEPIARKSPTTEQIEAWIAQFESDSYATRHLAFKLLKFHPQIAIPVVERSIGLAEEDAASRLVRLLTDWSTHPEDGYGRAAYASLQRVAQGGVAARSCQAQRSIEAIKLIQGAYATDYLNHLSAYIGEETGKIFIFNSNSLFEEYYVLKIDEAFRGSIDDLDRVSWLTDVNVVRLIGEQIDGNWLKKIIKIPNLRTLQIRHTSITSEDLTLLYTLNQLDGLEILYSPIDDAAIEVLGNLPLNGRLRLFGTNMSAKGVAQLNAQLEGSEIMFGRGGFLGVQSLGGTLTISQTTAGGGAEKAGLQRDDKIISANGTKLGKFDDLRAELAKHSPGEVVVIEFERAIEELADGKLKSEMKILQAEVTLGEQP